MTPDQLVVGDPRHGVVRYAHELAESLGVPVVETPNDAPAHVHFTDRLWGANPDAAASAFEALAARTPVSVTLHDVPGARDAARRAPGYRRVVAAARAVVVCSRHERTLLREHTDPDAEPAVIPLWVEAVREPPSRPEPDDAVALLGFVYPGKGHAEAIAAVASLEQDVAVVALGGPSAGHEQDLDLLADDAARRGVRFAATGYLDEDALRERCRRARVPLAAHRHVSASGSMNSWIACGRRPLVPDGRYTREMERLRPGTLTLYDPERLAAAIAHALENPETTWVDPAARLRPARADVAAAYTRWWRAL